jgi:hypothetical protein
MTNAPRSLTRDHLTRTTDASMIELTEQELSRVTGSGIQDKLPATCCSGQHYSKITIDS